ncbi:MAG: type II secretion system protein [Holosporaceae bacterium]|nr:MAG: type II secretion system protein [Holosporaceae bacterium]
MDSSDPMYGRVQGRHGANVAPEDCIKMGALIPKTIILLVYCIFSTMMRWLKKNDGFALVEVSIALIVMGVVMGVGLPSFLHYLKWQKIKRNTGKARKNSL